MRTKKLSPHVHGHPIADLLRYSLDSRLLGDFCAVHNGFVSVTPLHIDMTNHKIVAASRSWDLENITLI